MDNGKLKDYAASKGVRLWRIAEKFGVSDVAFTKKLRHNLSQEDAERFKAYVDEIASEEMKGANKGLKLYASNKGVRSWQVADKFGITDANFSRKLRKELSKEDAELFKRYVDEIASEDGGDNND